MIKNAKLLSEFEDRLLRQERLSYKEALKLFEAMWKEAVSFGVLPLKDPMEDLEADIALAKVLNSCLKNS
ncbi:MAG: hypothetical protein HY805_10240 [Nitrospirae bacterium]|nr:hypothetical protein [Nitrospirota bacterium]